MSRRTACQAQAPYDQYRVRGMGRKREIGQERRGSRKREKEREGGRGGINKEGRETGDDTLLPHGCRVLKLKSLFFFFF